MNYAEISFINKEPARIAVINDEEESHYAEVIPQKSLIKTSSLTVVSTVNQEILCRLNSDYIIEKPRIKAKQGDVFITKEQEKNGTLTGLLLLVTQKSNNHHPNVSIPTNKLDLYVASTSQTAPTTTKPAPITARPAPIAVKPAPMTAKPAITPVTPAVTNNVTATSAAFSVAVPPSPTSPMALYAVVNKPKPPSTPLVSSNYVDMSDMNSQKEFNMIASFVPEIAGKILSEIPTISSPTLEKIKPFSKDKIAKLKPESLAAENEISVFAVGDRKSSSKEKDILSFKRKQLGILLFASSSKWWLVRTMDGSHSAIGWVPSDYWRILPENASDDVSSPSYNPWIATSLDKSTLENLLHRDGKDRSFAFVQNKMDGSYFLLLKRQREVLSLVVNTMPDKNFLCSGHSFQTLYNLVLYFKRVPLRAGDPECTLGSSYV